MQVFESAEIYENVGVVFQDTMAYIYTHSKDALAGFL